MKNMNIKQQRQIRNSLFTRENRLIYANGNPNQPPAGPTPAPQQAPPTAPPPAANEVDIEAGRLERMAAWTGRRVEAAFSLPGHAVDHSFGAVQGVGDAVGGVYDWAKGNVNSAWINAQGIAYTGWEWGKLMPKEIYRNGYLTITGIRNEMREKFGKLFSKGNTNLLNFIPKKIGQSVSSLVSPITGLIKGEAKWLVGDKSANDKYYQQNVFQRTANTIVGDTRYGVKALFGNAEDLAKQTFYRGPVESGFAGIAKGIKRIALNTRNLASRVIETGVLPTPTGIYPIPFPEAISESMRQDLRKINTSNDPSYDANTQNIPYQELEQRKSA
jgi:hypothetical protein